jgi:hypothetical protein
MRIQETHRPAIRGRLEPRRELQPLTQRILWFLTHQLCCPFRVNVLRQWHMPASRVRAAESRGTGSEGEGAQLLGKVGSTVASAPLTRQEILTLENPHCSLFSHYSSRGKGWAWQSGSLSTWIFCSKAWLCPVKLRQSKKWDAVRAGPAHGSDWLALSGNRSRKRCSSDPSAALLCKAPHSVSEQQYIAVLKVLRCTSPTFGGGGS